MASLTMLTNEATKGGTSNDNTPDDDDDDGDAEGGDG